MTDYINCITLDPPIRLNGKESFSHHFSIAISLFGTFQVTVAEKPTHKFRTTKSRALLAYLVMARGQPVLRSTLTQLLWPDYLDTSARASLRQAVADLRKLFVHTDIFFLTITPYSCGLIRSC